MLRECEQDAVEKGAEPARDGAKRRRPSRRKPKLIDGRTREARRMRELEASYLADLDTPNEADRALARQAAALTVESEAMQAAIARGERFDPDDGVRLSNALARCLSGLHRRSQGRGRPGTPSIDDYVAAISKRREGAAA